MQLTKSKLDLIKKLSPGLRSKAFKKLGQIEFERCSQDPVYWLDYRQHAVPYVYTLDPKPLYVCKLCGPDYQDITHSAKHRPEHLTRRHMINTKDKKEIENYFHALPTIRPFTVKSYMPPIIEAWLDTNLFAIEKSRDMMATWLMVALATWDVFFHEGKQHIFQSEDGMKTLELVKRADFIINHQPSWLRDINPGHAVAGGNRSGILILPNLNSEILGFPQGPDQIRQFHPSGVFVDEAAYQDQAAAAFQAIKPAIQEGGKYYAISSANPGFFEAICADTSDED